MKLTKASTHRELADSASYAGLQRARHNNTEQRYQSAFAVGSLSSLIAQMAYASPKALKILNDYVASTPAAQTATDACGDIGCDNRCPDLRQAA